MPKILLVDDNEENRDSLCRLLECRGFNVVQACDGREGIALARSEKPDLILMDLNMPDLDGWEATRILKGAKETKLTPVIAMTAHALAKNQESAMAAGCDGYHTKPIDFANLLREIETTLKAALQATIDLESTIVPEGTA